MCQYQSFKANLIATASALLIEKPIQNLQSNESNINGGGAAADFTESRFKESLMCMDNVKNQRVGSEVRALETHAASLLKDCASIKSFAEVKKFHSYIILNGTANMLLETKLVDLYSEWGLEDARQLFDKMLQRNVFAWTEIISGYIKHGYWEETLALYCQMQEEGVRPDHFVYPKVLRACAQLAALQDSKEIHSRIIRSGYESNVYVANALMDVYVKCGSIQDARRVFDKMPQRILISWNTMTAGYAHGGQINDASELFRQMQHENTEPDVVTLNAMVTGYANCGQCDEAFKLFQQMRHDKSLQPNVISWTAIIAGYSQNGHHGKALELFHEMQQSGVKPNLHTITSTLSACAHLAALQRGKEIHGYIFRSTYDEHSSVGSALVAMYTGCGNIDDAQQVFGKITKNNVVLWNAIIAGYSQNGYSSHALKLFRHMQLVQVKPNSVTMTCLLPACAGLALLQQGKEIHNYIVRSSVGNSVSVWNALIDMYAKCGCINNARRVFDKMPERDIVSWTAMITGYGVHGHGKDALALFSQMQQTGIKPNRITFTCVLSACSHAGLVDEGLDYFYCMSRDHQMKPSMEQYACMVDLLGRAGRLDEAQKFIDKMPFQPNACLWGALLSASRIHSNIQVGEYAAEQLYELEPEHAGNYVLMSKIYAAAGRWDDVSKVRKIMEDLGLKKPPGCSWIEVKNRLHS